MRPSRGNPPSTAASCAVSALPSRYETTSTALWDALPSSALLVTRDGQALHVNAAFSAFSGLSATAAQGRGWLAAVAVAAQPALLAALQRGEDFSLQLLWLHRQPDGSLREAWVECASHWRAEEGDHVCLLHDMSPARRAELAACAQAEQLNAAEQAVRESEERLSKFMQASCEGIVFHKDGFITDANAPACALVGYELAELLGRRTLDFVAPDQAAKVAAVMAAGQEIAYESALIDKVGRRIAVEFIVRSMWRGGVHTRMTVVRDIRDRQAALARIHHLAHHDALTGLPNRLAFMEQLEPLMAKAKSSAEPLALLFIDLDHFKRVNDSLGHLAGDALLQTVGERIVALLRASDRVARFGGDEFMVLLSGGLPREVVAEVAMKLLAAIEAPLHAGGRPISVTPSIGIAVYPGDGDTPAQLIKNADAAMYLAKARGRANVQFFDPALASSAMASLVMEGQLAQALQRGEFVLHFQPQVRASDGVLVGAEALVRWHHPERGLLLPDEFIPLAERQRLMLPLGLWVLREAASAARRWHDGAARGAAGVPVAVNLTTLQFQAAGFVEGIEEVLRESGLPGHLLELELTERMLMDDLGEVRHKLGRLKALGILLTVDDFGTGYSSLGHLKELPIDKMKIDRSFVTDLPQRRDSAAIASAIIQMARSLGITVIAEGVETEAQRDFLARERCDELQGEVVSPPLAVGAFEAWMARAAGG